MNIAENLFEIETVRLRGGIDSAELANHDDPDVELKYVKDLAALLMDVGEFKAFG